MKRGKLQCKDIPTEPILRFLASLPRPAGWHDLQPRADHTPTVLDSMPAGTPPRVALAKMGKLIAAGLVDGCGCGCRGDFTLSEVGRAQGLGETAHG